VLPSLVKHNGHKKGVYDQRCLACVRDESERMADELNHAQSDPDDEELTQADNKSGKVTMHIKSKSGITIDLTVDE
jgi:hypothetical protein